MTTRPLAVEPITSAWLRTDQVYKGGLSREFEVLAAAVAAAVAIGVTWCRRRARAR